MQVLLFLALGTFVFAFTYTPLCRDIFRRLHVFDHPDGDRKLHTEPIPRVGGIVFALAMASTYALTFLFGDKLQLAAADDRLALAWRILPGAGVIFVTGLLDDLFSLPAWQKLLGQLIGAGWAYLAGLRVMAVAGYSADSWLTLPLTIGWLVLCTNAFNLIDGVDGLATGAGLFATLTIVIGALIQGNMPLLILAVPVAAFLLGFLRYNFNPATVFLGDSGSLLLGFLLGCFGVIWSLKSATLLGMIAPLMAMFVPILDVGLSVIRRFLRHQPIFGADRGHIHHRLLDRGLPPRRAVLLLYVACGTGALFSVIQTVAARQFGGLIILVFCAAAWIGVQHLGYVEFSMAGRMLLTGSFQRMLDAQLRLKTFEEELGGAADFEECWQVLVAGCQSFGFAGLAIDYRGHRLSKEPPAPTPEARWTILIPLPGDGHLELTREFEAPEQAAIVVPLVHTLRSRLPEKLESLVDQRPFVMAYTGD